MKLRYFLYGILFLLLITCKTKTDVEVPPTEMEVFVQDELGTRPNNVRIWLFDNEANYAKSASSDSAQGFVQTSLLQNGYVHFTQLDPNVHYWVLVSYRDSTRFLNIKNITSQNTISRQFAKSSVTTLNITLQPSNGIVSFWTTQPNANILDISVYLETEFVDSVNQVLTESPSSPLNNGTVTFNKDPGVYKWYAKGRNDCFWQGQFSLAAGEYRKIELPACENGYVTFYAQDDLLHKVPITVILNYTDTLGTIREAITSFQDCGQLGTITGMRPTGGYNYNAYSADGTCIWTGRLNVTREICTFKRLETCK
jgi:hypothetical protein